MIKITLFLGDQTFRHFNATIKEMQETKITVVIHYKIDPHKKQNTKAIVFTVI